LVGVRGYHRPRERDSERDEKLHADSKSRLPRLGTLVWAGLCQGLRSVPVLVPSLLVMHFNNT